MKVALSALVAAVMFSSMAMAQQGYPPTGCPTGTYWDGKTCMQASYPPQGCPTGTFWDGKGCSLPKK